MTIKIDRYELAWLDTDRNVTEAEVEVLGVDKLRAELEARRAGLRGIGMDVRTKSAGASVSDLGDTLNRDALNLWAAAVRMGLYDGPAVQWRTADYVGSNKLNPEPEESPDPTPPAAPYGDV